MVQGGTRVSLVQLLITPEEKKVARDLHEFLSAYQRHSFYTLKILDAHLFHAVSVPLLTASPTQGSVPLLQELHFYNLIDRRSILQLIYESRHQVLVVAREDAQMVSWLVSQTVLVICVQPYKYGGTTAETSKPFGEAAPFCAHCYSGHTILTLNRSHVSSNLLGFRTLQILRFEHLCCIDLLLVHTVQSCWQVQTLEHHMYAF